MTRASCRPTTCPHVSRQPAVRPASPSRPGVPPSCCILDGLAIACRRTIDDASRLSGRDIDVVHVAGGGTHKELLCQLTADACGRPVIAGPVEATARGNVLVRPGHPARSRRTASCSATSSPRPNRSAATSPGVYEERRELLGQAFPKAGDRDLEFGQVVGHGSLEDGT